MDSGNVWLIEVKHAIDGQVVLRSKFFNLAKKYMLNCVNAATLADWRVLMICFNQIAAKALILSFP